MDPTKVISKKHSLLKNLFLLLLILLITIMPLIIAKGAPFSGADGLAEEAIIAQNEGYEPWFQPLYEPASGEIESLLFSLQAAIGSGVIFFIFGYWQGKKSTHKK
jgi:cobalt/nickel transport protein